MKLKCSEKRVLGSIKQEDLNPASTVARSSTFTSKYTEAFGIDIKQEDTKEHENMLQQNSGFGKAGYYYRCNLCNRRMESLRSVLEHRKSIHNFKNSGRRKIKDIDLEPDVHDPNFYCKSCEMKFSDNGAYRSHLRNSHHMVLKPTQGLKSLQNDIVPDPDDPNFYCKACDHTYNYKGYYKDHCKFVHGLTSVKYARQWSIAGGLMINSTYCKFCDRRLAKKRSYFAHLHNIHKVDWRTLQQEPTIAIPDVNDSNFYCRSCDKTLANKPSFKMHLKIMHAIFPPAPRNKSKLEPDDNDPNNYCRACQKTYISKRRYRIHLRLIHQMTFPSVRGNADHKNLPDPYDPHYYCSVCKRTSKTRQIYRKHCKIVHSMVFHRRTISSPKATIDVNDPKHHCAQCEYYYCSKSSFRKHLMRVHHIKLVS